MNAPVAPAAVTTDRQRFIGGSDVAGILGVSPWDTPLDIYLKKTGQRPDLADPDPAKMKLFRWGKLLEPVVIKHLRQDYGIRVTKMSTARKPNRYQDAEHPFLAAEIDFEWRVTKQNADEYALDPMLIGTIQNGEIKTVHFFAKDKFGEELTEDVPIEYAAQAMHGLMVAPACPVAVQRGFKGRQLTLFGVLTGTRDVTMYWIKRDEQTISEMRPRVVRFWHDHVLPAIPPAPVNLPDVLKIFHRAPALMRADATPEIAALVGELEIAKAQRDQAEDREAEVKYEIGKFVLGESSLRLGKGGKLEATATAVPGEHLLLFNGAPLMRVSLHNQSRLDAERLKIERPEIIEAYQKPISFFKFQKPKKGKR